MKHILILLRSNSLAVTLIHTIQYVAARGGGKESNAAAGALPSYRPAAGRRRLRSLNPPEWIKRLHPRVVLLSVAPGDHQGLPSPETLEAVKAYTLLRTDRNWWIELTPDREQKWVEVERK